MIPMSSEIFDLKRVKQLVELMKVNDLTDLEIKQGEAQITLRRGSHAVMSVPMQAAPVLAQSAVAPAVPEEPTNSTVITSPMVGTFYSASRPDTPPFVKVGDTVTPEKTVCLIEAMKVYNEIQAECSGKIVAVLVKNGEMVEFGKPLFRIAVE
jgi:acetyl-CoA carboxylase biotin carboxyl carrier protein